MSGFQSANNNNTDMFPQDYADKDIFMKPTNTKKATNSITSDVLTNSQKTT